MMTIGFALPSHFQIMGLAAASAFELANVVAGEKVYSLRLLSEKGGPLPNSFGSTIDTRVLGSNEWLAQRLADFDAIIHGTQRADPAVPVRLPGEIELDRLAKNRREGIAVDPAVLARLEALAAA